MKILQGLELMRFIRDENLKLKDKPSLVAFRYYVAVNWQNKTEIFRFMKGGDLKMWALATAKYKRILGPFKTMKDAVEYTRAK